MKRIFGLSACAALVFSVACGSTDDAGGGSGRAVPLEELPERYASASCIVARACWGDLLDVLLAGESCESNAETAISDELAGLEQAIADGKVEYDGTRAEECFDAVVARGCSDAAEPAACTQTIDGTVAIGGDCSKSVECKGSETYCKSDGTCPGQCAARETAGGSCAGDDECQPGLRCDEESQRCFEPAAAGDRCGGGIEPECEAGLYCLGEDRDQGRAGNCRTIEESFSGGAGERCLLDAPFCRADLRCVIESVDTTTGSITTACRPPLGSGAACKLSYPDVCPLDEYCAVQPQALEGTCTAKPGAGEPCASRGDDPANICAPGTRCDGGQCRSRQKLGASCQTDDVCYSDQCLNGGCASAGACE
jgi:hypothetical protein